MFPFHGNLHPYLWSDQDVLPTAHRTRRRAFIFNGFGARISLGPFQFGFGPGPDETQSVEEIAKQAPVASVPVPQLGLMPPGGGMLPPGGLMAAGGVMLPPGGLMPSGGGMLPPGGGVMSPGGMLPPGGGMLPPGRGVMPPGGMLPPGGLMPPGGGMFSPGGGVMSPGGMLPPGGLMSSGGGMMPSEGGMSSSESSVDSEPRYTGPLPDVDSIMSKLAASLTLHDNLVTVFGFLLTKADGSLGLELYVSLQQLLDATRQRAVRTVELLRLLQDMAREDPHRQLVRLFFELPKTCPRYLIGAIKTWQEALTNNKVNMTEMMMNAGRNVSLLQKIDPGLFPVMSSPTAFSEASSRFVPAQVSSRMGKIFGNIMGEIINNSLDVTLPLVGYLLMHLQLSLYSPEVEEARQYLKDVLVENRSEHRVAVSSLSPSDKQDMYALVGAVLRALPTGDVFVLEAVHAVLPYLHTPDCNTHNPYLSAMAPIVGGDHIQYDLLFKLVTAGEFPDDIVMCKDKLMMSISGGKLDMETVLDGFVRYEYKKPLDLLLAVLQRIRRRARLEDDLLDAVIALDVHVKMKRAAIEMDDDKIRGIDDLLAYFDAFCSPFLPEEVRSKAHVVADVLQMEPIDWSTWLARFPRSEYSRPRQLVISLLEALAQGGELKSENLQVAMHDFQEAVKPPACPKVTCPPKSSKKEKAVADAIPMQQLLDVFHILLPEDEQQLTVLKSLLLNPISLATALGDDFPLHQYETKGVLMQAILGVCLRSELVRQSPQLKRAVEYFLPRVRLDGPGAERVSPLFVTTRTIDMNKVLLALTSAPLDDEQHTHFQRVVTFLEEAFYQPQFSGGFHVTNFKTRADFITGLFNHLLSLEATPADLKEDLTALLPLVDTTGLGAQPVDYVENEPQAPDVDTSTLPMDDEEVSGEAVLQHM
ncbi:uncharacterized protein [Anabrus simplex]|uniref:uncharacterized protein isoform X2 n=1 Tax=Anabrus simplex TaxID=316456 RepID=UPI0035A3B803